MTDEETEREREQQSELHRQQMAEKSNVRTARERESRLQELAEQTGEYLDEIEATRDELEAELQAARESATETLRENVAIADLQTDHLEAFADEPYCVLPKAENEYYVVVPRFVPFNVGWLNRQTDSYNIFVVNKYVSWITDLPDEIRGSVGLSSEFDHATVEDGILELGDEDERDRAWDELGGRDGGLFQRDGDRAIKIKDGCEFDVIASLIEKGNLPFKPNPVSSDDLLGEPDGVQLDDPAHVPENADYQQRAWEKFKETGMVGIYWPPSAGKTFFALYAGDRLKGHKLVVVPPRHRYEFPLFRYKAPGPDFHTIWFNICKGAGWKELQRHVNGGLQLITGVRQAESETRAENITAEVDRETSNFRGWYLSIFYEKSDEWVEDYIADHDLEANPLYSQIGRSGDCYCNAYGRRDEILYELAAHYPRHYAFLMNVERRMQEYHGRLAILRDRFPAVFEYADDVLRTQNGTPYPLIHEVLRDELPVVYEWAKRIDRARAVRRGMQDPKCYFCHGKESSQKLKRAAEQVDTDQTSLCGPSCKASRSVMGLSPDVRNRIEQARAGSATQEYAEPTTKQLTFGESN